MGTAAVAVPTHGRGLRPLPSSSLAPKYTKVKGIPNTPKYTKVNGFCSYGKYGE